MAEHDSSAARRITVEVVYADPDLQILRKVEIAAKATVFEAVVASGILPQLPAGYTPAGFGIFGRPVARDAHLHAGDRIELYRALLADPKESRRRRAGGR